MQTHTFRNLSLTLAIAGALGTAPAWAGSTDQNAQDSQQSDAQQSVSETNNATASASGIEAESTKTAYYAAGILQGQMQQTESQQIPQQLLSNVQCVGVFPAVLKVGLVFAGAHGDGIISCRDDSGSWDGSAPVFFGLSSGSVGAQAGAKTTELIVLFNDKSAVKQLSDGSFKFGANVDVTAGELGAHAKVSTQPAPIVAYRMDQTGAFAGADIEGTVIQANDEANHNIYGQNVTTQQLLSESTQIPENVQVFNRALAEFTSNQSSQPQGSQSNNG
ncbi:lipid-binding SYLF domain-containing protein [Halomonas sp. HP20-15]|uniref:lipid-binding SYLF domain-containing protein n=1 Tax=Halomonas sp. HP20-15 TaxID=3085901 RepID=UPI00298261FE|nr:lipid-binding SYLF domain-containing protein [Halomonas sp. HP20-15]MDW5377121.1 lipid-binding SYLF domain-containing protein [Halomonas sp. HP20-15]